MFVSPLRQKYIESLLVLLKMQFLSMKTTVRGSSLWICMGLLQILWVGGCASGVNRKKALFFQSNQGLEVTKTVEAPGNMLSATLPIGPDESAKYPHLGPFRGNIFLARDGLQVVVSGEQTVWTPSAPTSLVPLVLGVFESRIIGGKKVYVRNPALDGVMLRVECPAKCPSGFSVRLEGLEESSPEPGVSGLALSLVSLAGAEKKTIAQIRVQIGGGGPGIFFESLPAEGSKVRLSFDPQGATGSLLAVREGDLIDGGDSERLSYVQVESAGGQVLVLPSAASSVTLSGNLIKVSGPPGASPMPTRWWLFAGDKAVQDGFHLALEQELGATFGAQELKFDSVVTGAGSMQTADSWLANDSGDPLLLLSLVRRPVLQIPLEAYSGDVTPLPFVLRLAGVLPGEHIQAVAGNLLKVLPEVLEQVSFYGQPESESLVSESALQLPDMVAVAPLGADADQRKILLRLVPADGVEATAPGIASTRQWPVRMQLPQGIYEAFFIVRSKGLMCRVPFDVSRRQGPGAIPSVACSPAQRVFQKMRLPKMDGVMVNPAAPALISSVRNRRLGVDFGVSPALDPVTESILKGIGRGDPGDSDGGRRILPSARRTIFLPCPLNHGLIESLRATPLATNDTMFAVPSSRCSLNPHEDSWGWIEQLKAAGLRSSAVIQLPTMNLRKVPLGGSVLDALFPMETVTRTKADSIIAGDPILARAGTFISVDSVRRIDPTRAELVVRIGRASNAARYLDPPWKLRRLRILSRGAVLSEVQLDAGRHEYKMLIQLNAVNSLPIRVDLTGRFQGTLANVFDTSDDFVVAETQLLEVK